MSYSVVSTDINPFKSDEEIKELRKELDNYQKCVKGNSKRFFALTTVKYACGSQLDPSCCEPVAPEMIKKCLNHLVELVLFHNMKQNGETENWSVGGMGSRWFDLDAEEFKCDYARVAFYSKKTFDGEWVGDKPYILSLTIEKGRD